MKRRSAPGRARLIKTVPFLPFLLGALSACGNEDAEILYDRRIRGQVILPPGYAGDEVFVEAETFDEAPSILARVPADSDGRFEIHLPDGEYRVSVELDSGAPIYYADGGSRPLADQATPVTVARGLETPRVVIPVGALQVDVTLPGAAADWSVDGGLFTPVLRVNVGHGRDEVAGDDVVRLTFPAIAASEYLLRLSLYQQRGTSLVYDSGFVPVEIAGRSVDRIAVPGGAVVEAAYRVAGSLWIRGEFEGPSVSRPDARLDLYFWEVDAQDGEFSAFDRIELDESTSFEEEFFFPRDLQLQWVVEIPGPGHDQTGRWLGSWSRSASTRIRPDTTPVPIRLEAVGIEVQLRRPDSPGRFAGWLEVQDETGQTRSSYYVDEAEGYEGPIFFSNLAPGRYVLHYRRSASSPALEQYYGDGISLTLPEATPIDLPQAGGLLAIEWSPYPGGSITGCGTLADGGPATNHTVIFTPHDSQNFTNAGRTDELGCFAVAGLTDGRYKVGLLANGQTRIYWYPGTTSWDEAATLEITDYGSLEGVDIQLSGRPTS